MTAGAESPGHLSDPTPGRQAVVIVNYGLHELIETNLTSGADPLAGRAEVIVVDNFSTDAERTAITDVCDRHDWRLLPQTSNLGFGPACNVGIEFAARTGAGNVLLINPDAVVPGSVAVALSEQLREHPLDLISPRVLTSAHTPYFHGIQLDLASGRMRNRPWPGADAPARYYPVSDPGQRDWVGGACMAFSVELWRRAGGWDESYFLYWEDVDFSQRCVQAGAQICIRHDLLVIHDEGATHGSQRSRARSTVYYYFNCRNRLRYAARHLSRRAQLAWLARTPQESWQILLRGGRRQILESPGTLWSAVRGSVAGAIGLLGARRVHG